MPDEVTNLRLGAAEQQIGELREGRHADRNTLQAIAVTLKSIEMRLDSSDTMRGEMKTTLIEIKDSVSQIEKAQIKRDAEFAVVKQTVDTASGRAWKSVGAVALLFLGLVVKELWEQLARKH